jgi:hypothetical protein
MRPGSVAANADAIFVMQHGMGPAGTGFERVLSRPPLEEIDRACNGDGVRDTKSRFWDASDVGGQRARSRSGENRSGRSGCPVREEPTKAISTTVGGRNDLRVAVPDRGRRRGRPVLDHWPHRQERVEEEPGAAHFPGSRPWPRDWLTTPRPPRQSLRCSAPGEFDPDLNHTPGATTTPDWRTPLIGGLGKGGEGD